MTEMINSCAAPRELLGMAMLFAALLVSSTSSAAPETVAKSANTAPVSASTSSQPTEIAPPMVLTVGKSTLLRTPREVTRISVGDPEVADIVLLNVHEVYLLGKHAGATNVFLWAKGGGSTVIDLSVGVDTTGLTNSLRLLMPGEHAIAVSSLGDSLVLSGQVSDAVKVQRAMQLAEQIGGKKVINMLTTVDVPQVMLEVKVAEVSKTLVDQLGAQLNGSHQSGGFGFSLLSSLLTGSASALTLTKGATTLSLDAEAKNGLVKILAEPTIMAISGQEGAFLAGGKIFIPVPQGGGTGGTTITLQQEEFGIGLKFTPTVLDGGRINLRVTPEVSELSQTGSAFTTVNQQTTVVPTITTRRVSTTVQLMDGQSFAIGGLIKNNVTQNLNAIPGLGELPVLGALFRSTEFQSDRTELLFVITPRLVKPLDTNIALPTDKYIAPGRSEFLIGGHMEGTPADQGKGDSKATGKTDRTVDEHSKQPSAASGFEVK